MDTHYDNYDDFSINQTRTGGGAKAKRKDKTFGGSCYNSKHILIQEVKKDNSKDKKPINTN
jgi:hypothetical protein